MNASTRLLLPLVMLAASTAQGSDKAAAMEAQAKLLEGSSVGRVIQDRQALMALIAGGAVLMEFAG